jgi:uncharacterized phage infection (PIP) family protein YhgE
MSKIVGKNRFSHQTLTTSGLTFSVPPSEDFTDGTWNVNGSQLCLSEIGINESDNKAYVRIGSNINQFQFVGGTDSLWLVGDGVYSIKANNDSGLIASGDYSLAEGKQTTASGYMSHAEGSETVASGIGSHAEGQNTTADGQASHSEGSETIASGSRSHAEGYMTIASGDYSHSEGIASTASGQASHTEGWETTASGDVSHAEGYQTISSGYASHAGGLSSIASGTSSFVHGSGSTASGLNTIVLGSNINGTIDNMVYVSKLSMVGQSNYTHVYDITTLTQSTAVTSTIASISLNNDETITINATINAYCSSPNRNLSARLMASFMKYGGTIYQTSTTDSVIKDGFGDGTTATIDTNGTSIRIRVTNGSTLLTRYVASFDYIVSGI